MKSLVLEIEESGGELFLLNGGLKLFAPRGAITHDLQARIRKNKIEIINFVTQQIRLTEDHPESLPKSIKPEFSSIPFKIKVEPKKLLTDEFRSEKRIDRKELVDTLMGTELNNSQGGKETSSPSCWKCHQYDGTGAAWPGKCRYFELLGQEAREIDFNFVNPDEGCRFFLKATQGNDTIESVKLDNQSLVTQADIMAGNLHRPQTKLPSPVALLWLLEHREALSKAGWTRPELYRRNVSKRGIAWLELWDKPFFMAYLHDSGVIEFEYSINGRDVFQTAQPQEKTI